MAKARGGQTPRLGARLKELREARGEHASHEWVAQQLAKLGYETNRTTFWKYERGRPPDVGILMGLARVYGADFIELCRLMATDLMRGTAPVELSPVPPSDEAMTIARAFDRGPDTLRNLLRQAVALSALTPGSDQVPHAQEDDAPIASTHGNLGRKQKRKAH